MKHFKTTLLLTLLLLSIVVKATSPIISEPVSYGYFELYESQPDTNARCRMFTELIIDDGGILGDVAKLENRIHPSSYCFHKVFIDPNIRIYKLHNTSGLNNRVCSPVIYKGAKLGSAIEGGFITIRDYRHILCRKMVHKVITVDIIENGKVTKLAHDVRWSDFDVE